MMSGCSAKLMAHAPQGIDSGPPRGIACAPIRSRLGSPMGGRSPMKKIDAFNHIFPKGFYDKMMEVAGGLKDMGKRVRGVPMLVDLDERFRVMDKFGPDYVQILSLASPPLEVMAGANATPELAKRANDGMAELCRKYPKRFPGFIA